MNSTNATELGSIPNGIWRSVSINGAIFLAVVIGYCVYQHLTESDQSESATSPDKPWYYRAGHKMGCWLVSIPLTLLTEDRQRYENAGDGDFMALHVLLVRINLITTIFSAISLAINWFGHTEVNHTGHDWFEHTTLGNLRSDTQLALVRIPTIVIGAVLAPLPFLKRVVTAIHRDQEERAAEALERTVPEATGAAVGTVSSSSFRYTFYRLICIVLLALCVSLVIVWAQYHGMQSLTKSLEELPSRASQLLIQWVAPVFTVVVVTVQQFIIIHHHRLSAKATQTGLAVEETTSWELMVRLYTYYVMTVAVLPTVGLTSMQALFDINNSEWASIYLPDKGAIFINLLLTDALLSGASDLSNAFELCCYAVRRLRGQPGPLILIYDFYYEIQMAQTLSSFSLAVMFALSCPLISFAYLLTASVKMRIFRCRLSRSPAGETSQRRRPLPVEFRWATVALILIAFEILLLTSLGFTIYRRLDYHNDASVLSIVYVAVYPIVASAYTFSDRWWRTCRTCYAKIVAFFLSVVRIAWVLLDTTLAPRAAISATSTS